MWTSYSSLQVHPLLCVCGATDGTEKVCVIEERETGSVLAPPHSSRQSVHLPLPPSHHLSTLLPLFFLLSVGSISEAAGAARREQVAAFKVVKMTESRKKRSGPEKCVCVCVYMRGRKRKKLKGTKKRGKGKDRQREAGNR